jgi:hypothetical protein
MAQQRSRRKSSGGISRKSRSPVDHHEVEWQFDAGELEPVEAWLRHHSSGAGLVVKPEPEEKIADAYYDSQDWRFYRAGYALRVRKAGTDTEATMGPSRPPRGTSGAGARSPSPGKTTNRPRRARRPARSGSVRRMVNRQEDLRIRALPVPGGISRKASVLDLGEVAPGVGLRAVKVR